MTAPRSLGSIPTSLTQANNIWWFWFVSITLPTGIQRFTDHALGDQSLNVDGLGTNTWVGSDGSDLIVDHLDQSQQNILSVSAIHFANLGNPPQFTTWANTAWADGTTGLRGKKVQIWQGWFDSSNNFQGAVKVYEGTIDNQDLGVRAMLALKPYLTTWGRNTPWAIPVATCIFPYKDPQSCQYSGVGSVNITAGGTGFTSAPTVVFTGGGGSGAAGTAVLSGNTVASVTITSAGSNYVTAPTISFSGGGGTGAAATAAIANGAVVSITVTAPGSGYTSAPAVAFANNATGATATATISGGAVTAVTMTASGSNYGSVMPTVSFSGGGGTGATATASSEIAGETTCGKTRSSCTARFHQAFFGGFDLMPRPGDTVKWSGTATTYGGNPYGPFGTWQQPGGKVRIVRSR